MSLFANLVKHAVEKVQERNRNNPNIETADTNIFDKLNSSFFIEQSITFVICFTTSEAGFACFYIPNVIHYHVVLA